MSAARPARGIVLAFAFGTGDQQPHESLDMGNEQPVLYSIRINEHFIVPHTRLSTKCVFR